MKRSQHEPLAGKQTQQHCVDKSRRHPQVVVPISAAKYTRAQVLECAQTCNRRKQKKSVVTEVIYRETTILEQAAEFDCAVAASMIMGGIVLAPQPAERRHC